MAGTQSTPGQDHYIGIDVGTGSARACIIDAAGDIKALASENIQLWQTSTALEGTHYEQSTTDIWKCIGICVRRVLADSGVEAAQVKGLGFDATCSLAVLTHDSDEPVPVTSPDFVNDGNDRNVILWLDHRPRAETDRINATGHKLLRYVGGTMSVEMEMPKVLWLKNHMPPALFDRCCFYDLADALTHLATGAETRSFCSAVCKQAYVPVGVDGSVKGWQEDFYRAVGLGDLVEGNFKRMGGVDGVNGRFLSAGELVGPLSEKAAAELGLQAGTAVGSGVIDAYAGWIGTVGAEPGTATGRDILDAYSGTIGSNPPAAAAAAAAEDNVELAFHRLAAVAGTSTCHLVMSAQPVFVDGVWGPYRDVLVPGRWMAEGGQSATGELLRHTLETHEAYRETAEAAAAAAAAAGQPVSIYSFLNDRLRQLADARSAPSLSHLTRHLFVYGDLWGNRSPLADPAMAGAVVGLTADRGPDALALLYHATMEFIALQTRQIVRTMNDAGHSVRSIFMSGSQCQNDILMDLIAAATGLPIVTPKYANAAVVHGAAMLGAKAANPQPLWTIMRRMSKPGTVVQPHGDQARKRLLDAKYGVFLDQCRTQQEYRKIMDAASAW